LLEFNESRFVTLKHEYEIAVASRAIKQADTPTEPEKPRQIGQQHSNKQKLNQVCQLHKWGLPVYTTRCSGNTIDTKFSSTCKINGLEFSGLAYASKVEAEQSAAGVAYTELSQISLPKVSTSVSIFSINYKGALQEFSQKQKWGIPSYVALSNGQPHCPSFVCTVEVNGMTFSSSSHSKVRVAENDAARIALSVFQNPDHVHIPPQTMVLERCRKDFKRDPVFIVLEETGPSHAKMFKMQLILPNGDSYVTRNSHANLKSGKEELAALAMEYSFGKSQLEVDPLCVKLKYCNLNAGMQEPVYMVTDKNENGKILINTRVDLGGRIVESDKWCTTLAESKQQIARLALIQYFPEDAPKEEPKKMSLKEKLDRLETFRRNSRPLELLSTTKIAAPSLPTSIKLKFDTGKLVIDSAKFFPKACDSVFVETKDEDEDIGDDVLYVPLSKSGNPLPPKLDSTDLLAEDIGLYLITHPGSVDTDIGEAMILKGHYFSVEDLYTVLRQYFKCDNVGRVERWNFEDPSLRELYLSVRREIYNEIIDKRGRRTSIAMLTEATMEMMFRLHSGNAASNYFETVLRSVLIDNGMYIATVEPCVPAVYIIGSLLEEGPIFRSDAHVVRVKAPQSTFSIHQ